MSLSPEVLEPFLPDEPIRVNHLIHILNDFLDLHPEMPVVSDVGDCLFAAVDIRSNQCVAPAFYATMGFAIPGAIGAADYQWAKATGPRGRWGISDDWL